MTEKELLKKGFNHGYTLLGKDSDLAVQIASGFKDPSSPYAEGFVSGSVEYIKEKELDVSQFLKTISKEKEQKEQKGREI